MKNGLTKDKNMVQAKNCGGKEEVGCTYLTTKLQKIALQKIEKTEINGH